MFDWQMILGQFLLVIVVHSSHEDLGNGVIATLAVGIARLNAHVGRL
jgi:hypothetical protein